MNVSTETTVRGLVQHPYDPRRLEALVAYAEAHRPTEHASAPVRRLLTELSPPEGVIELRSEGRTVFVAAVVDKCENVEDAAVLEVLGLDEAADLSACVAVATPIALGVARAAGRRAVTVSLPEGRGTAPGWRPHVGGLVLTRGLLPWPRPPLPDGAAWVDLGPERLAAHYANFRASFAEDPWMMLPREEAFGAAALAADPPVRLLVRGAVELGFARVTIQPDQVGYVATIGRAPAARGAGVGPVVLAEALRVLAARGATRMRLGVTASNTAAIRLYQSFDFTVAERWDGWLLPVAR